MSDSFPPLIYVTLIEDEPSSRDAFRDRHGLCTGDDCTSCDDAYDRYVNKFQPWRVLVVSGDNHEPLFKSTESYLHRNDALHAISLAFGNGSNIYLRQAEHGDQVLRMAAK